MTAKTLLQTQYDGIKGARKALLTYCGSMEASALFMPVEAFNNSSISSLLVHSANTYLHWLKYFNSEIAVNYFNEEGIKGIDDIRNIYQQVDEVVNHFLNKYEADYQQTLHSKLPTRDQVVTLTPLQLFTHAITHEFHHKGQLLTMSRVLGYIPVDTDVIRT